MAPFIALLIQNMPTIVAGVARLFQARHPAVQIPADEQIIRALQAALSGSHDAGPLVALAVEQLPQIQAAMVKLFTEQHPDIANGPSAIELDAAWETSFRAACLASIAIDDKYLAAHPPK